MSDEDLGLALFIRHFERTLLRLVAEGHVRGTTHTCLGQEYIPVALAPLIAPAFVFSNHRGHGHYLAQFGDGEGLLAEITGRDGAVCGGRGGSQHIYRPGFCSTGVQGENVPVALGAAVHSQRRRDGRVAVVYTGDGTWGQGVVYEALNIAQLLRAPLVVVVENNGIAQSTPTGRAMSGTIAARAAAFGVRFHRVDHACIATIRRELREPVERTRAGDGPLVVEFRTWRLGPHSKGDDTRPPAEVARVQRHDWTLAYRASHPEQFDRVDDTQRRRVDELAEAVLQRPRVDGER
ncbi:thiamine pyrophosphate-dependent dehydrogenase E1 component subunit alpha [Dactylosporangium roseum]|uniref:Thiamine pyrophosphate-dependent dehydrogenase E1 component subunit alpha n=1 Tax=Dactylosporangium roseum TaxID=47989 RepID=A0ABY5ZJE5_9ACTN|nr:thiamine pyrophosphate-dependent dehydrogenase E1 component subunit alpha [Dactylosporangium roseum]